MPKLSIVTPCYNEEANLPVLYERLMPVLEHLEFDWEWILIDDCSKDGTYRYIQELCAENPRIKAIKMARNHGSHLALLCGFRYATGDAAILQTADLQDPPEQIPNLIPEWKNGAQVVWATRERGRDDPWINRLFSGLYYRLIRRLFGLQEVPETGGDMVLIDRSVIQALAGFNERNLNILVAISWVGFRQACVPGIRAARLHGVSSYNFWKKFALFVDTVTYFSARPIRWISLAGILISLAGFLYAGIAVINWLVGETIPGWTSLMVVILILNGLQLILLGLTGEYLWRTVEQSRNRPIFVIEHLEGELTEVGPAGKVDSASKG